MTEQAKLSALLHRAISCTHGLTNYVESRPPGLTAIERELAAIEAEFKELRALEASERSAPLEARNITVWKDGSYLSQKPLDDIEVRNSDPEWLCSIPLVSAYDAASERPALAVGEPVAWIIPGSDNARDNGFLDAMAWKEGEFTRPLYAAPPAAEAPEETEHEIYQRGYDKGFDDGRNEPPQLSQAEIKEAEAAAGQSGALSSLQEPMPVDPDVTPENPETPGTWQERCAALYQVIGTLSDQFGIFETSDDVCAALDVAAGRGDVSALLPWPKDATHGKASEPQSGWVSVPRKVVVAAARKLALIGKIYEGDKESRGLSEKLDTLLAASPPAAQSGTAIVPREIDRSKHRAVLNVWNDCLIEHESLEMTWPKLVKAIEAAQSGGASCNWNQDSEGCDTWESDCGKYFILNEGKPSENGMKFCFGCGKPLTESPYETEEDSADEAQSGEGGGK